MERNREEQENYKHSSTAYGLLSFILFSMGGFISFIVAEDAGKYKYYVILLGTAMLGAAVVVVCGILNETKKIQNLQPKESKEPQLEQGLLLQHQPDPEISDRSKTTPHWIEKTRFDFAYVRQVLGLPATESYQTTSSESDSDPDILELKRMAKYGLPPDTDKPVAGTRKEAQGTGCEGGQMDSTKAGPSKVADKGLEDVHSSSECIPLKNMSTLSLSVAASEKKKVDVSAALPEVSSGSTENEASIMAAYDTFSTDSEGKSEDQYVEDGKSSTLESKKEA